MAPKTVNSTNVLEHKRSAIHDFVVFVDSTGNATKEHGNRYSKWDGYENMNSSGDEIAIVNMNATDFTEITKITAVTPFKVIHGHQFWYQSKAHMRLPISD